MKLKMNNKIKEGKKQEEASPQGKPLRFKTTSDFS